MNITFTTRAWDDFEYWRTTDKVVFTRLRRLITEILRDPYEGYGSPKALRYTDEMWSRRLDIRHRIVYQVFDDRIEFHSFRGHYWYDR
jgi:toxin YoeB